MVAPISIPDLRVVTLAVPEDGISAQTRATILKQDSLVAFPVNMALLRVHDAFQTNLPGTAAADDLALIGGTFGTAPPTISAGDLKAVGLTTRYARFLTELPECYDPGETFKLSFYAGMVTTIADTSCTLDIEVYKLDKLTGISADLCATAAIDINSLVISARDFTITPSGLVAGDVFDVRIAIACTDAATGTAVTPTIAAFERLVDIKG